MVRNPERKIAVPGPQDLDLAELIHEFDMCRVSHLAALTGRSERRIRARTLQLFHSGFLGRLTDPVRYWGVPGSTSRIHMNEDLMEEWLELKRGIPFKSVAKRNKHWTDRPDTIEHKMRRLKNWQHELLIPDVFAAFAVACHESPMRLILPKAIRCALPADTLLLEKPFQWKASAIHDGQPVDIGVEPDKYFGLQRTNQPDPLTSYFFLEVDTGSEDVYQSDVTHTSLYQKFLAYTGTQAARLHEHRFGWRNFRVLFVVPDEKRIVRIGNMITDKGIAKRHGFNVNQYLFATFAMLEQRANLLTACCNLSREPVSLLPRT